MAAVHAPELLAVSTTFSLLRIEAVAAASDDCALTERRRASPAKIPTKVKGRTKWQYPFPELDEQAVS